MAAILAALLLSSQPNIVLIVADNLGWGDLGCYGSPIISTPNLDSLSNEGLRYTQAYCAAPVCAPARSALLTGTNSAHTRIQRTGRDQSLLDADVTLAEVLTGYHAVGYGKWGVGDINTQGAPEKQGFERFFGYYSPYEAHHYRPDTLVDTGTRVPNSGRFSAYVIAEEVLSFLEDPPEPFFLYFAPTLPHGMYEIPREDVAFQHYRNPPMILSFSALGHAAYVSLLDRQVGAIVDKLPPDTIVIFTSDNGPPTEFAHELSSTGPFSGGLKTLKEGGLRVPFIVWWPETVKPGERHDLVHAADLMPTVAEIASLPCPDTDGRSIVPTFHGPAWSSERELYWNRHARWAVRSGPWKLVATGPGTDAELYDLDHDPAETTDLAHKHPIVVQELLSSKIGLSSGSVKR